MRNWRRRNRRADISVCRLPCELINHVLGLELEDGDVVFTRAHQIHAERRHPEDYGLCLPHLAAVVGNPLYIGDDYENAGIELIALVPALGEFVLVAVNITPDASGRYQIASFYRVSQGKIQGRREKGFLKVAVKIPEKA